MHDKDRAQSSSTKIAARLHMGLTKKSAVHAVFFGLITVVVWQSQQTTTIDRNSLLYSFISGEEVKEGPLDPSAYAQTDTPGTGGARLAVVDASDVNLITFDDPEVTFAQTLGGNAIVAPLQPLMPEPGSDGETSPGASSESQKAHVYTVQEGDTIAGIAANFDISVNTILWTNGLNSKTLLKTGDHLTILPTTGVLHTVTSGDTVLGIASKYDAKGTDIVAYNSLEDSSRLSIGQKIIVPDGYIEQRTAPAVVSQGTRIAREEESGPTPEPAPATPGGGWVWPTTTKHISQYFKWGHTGIDIDNRSRPAVFAAQGGTVEFRGWLGGYGNLIILNHGSGLTTYYAHLDAFYVTKGQQVATGDAIGKMGSTGRSTGPHVHFEVRRNGSPTNPLGMY
ncbi:MAG: peptidoglycan DD-metalloendopeptidase family protein [Candidatus Andersenbacteria bacterium]